MRTIPNALKAVLNALTNRPIYLYRIQTSDNVADDVYIAQYNANVAYFKDTSTAQTYTAKPIRREGIAYNSDGEIDGLTIEIGNANREFGAVMELASYPNEGLRGFKVTVRRVDASLLADNTAYIEDIYYIDSSSFVGADRVSLSLKSKLDVLAVEIPGRRYCRSSCPWSYKGLGCWKDDGAGTPEAPADFEETSDDTCGKTLTECERHVNRDRFGGFWSIPDLGRFYIGKG